MTSHIYGRVLGILNIGKWGYNLLPAGAEVLVKFEEVTVVRGGRLQQALL